MPTATLAHDSQLVDSLYNIIFPLARLNIIELMYRRRPSRRLSFAFVDRFVIGHFFLTLLVVLLSFLAGPSVWVWCLVVYGVVRCLNILAIQAENLVWFELGPMKRAAAYARLWYGLPPQKRPSRAAPIESPMRSIILLLINYAEIVLWFGLLYFNIANEFSGDLSHPWTALALSSYVMSSFGISPQVQPLGLFAWASVALQTSLGLFMTLAVLGRFVAALRLRFRGIQA